MRETKTSYVFETERATLRRFNDGDAGNMHLLLGNPEVMRFSISGVKTKEKSEAFLHARLEQYNERGYGAYAIELKDTGAFAGYCGFHDQDIEDAEEQELSYRLLPDFWGKGLGSELATATMRYGFEKLSFERLIALIEPENLASVRIIKKCGFDHERDWQIPDSKLVSIYSRRR